MTICQEIVARRLKAMGARERKTSPAVRRRAAVDFAADFTERYFNRTRKFHNIEAHLSRAELAALIALAVEEARGVIG